MSTAAQSSRSHWLQIRSQWFAAVACIAALTAGASPAAAQGRRVSKDLVERLNKAARGEDTHEHGRRDRVGQQRLRRRASRASTAPRSRAR